MILSLSLQAAGGGSIFGSLAPMLIVFAILYFFFIRPQVKKQKEQNAFIKEMQKGDEVVTSSGIIGQISKLDDHEVTLQVDTKTFLRFTKGAISKEMTDTYRKTKQA